MQKIFGAIYRHLQDKNINKAVENARRQAARLEQAIQLMTDFEGKLLQSFEEMQNLKNALEAQGHMCCVFTLNNGLCGLVDPSGDLIATCFRESSVD
jgi:hypothetical protein